MKLLDMLRRRLREARPEDRAHETEHVVDLSQMRERFSIGSDHARPVSRAAYRMSSWSNWQDSLGELGIELHHFGKRGNASLGNDKQILIGLDNGQWQVQQRSPGGWETVARDWGRESLRAYLIKNGAPRHPSLKKR